MAESPHLVELLVSHGRRVATQSSTATSGGKFVIAVAVAVAVALVCDNTYLPMEFFLVLRRHNQGAAAAQSQAIRSHGRGVAHVVRAITLLSTHLRSGKGTALGWVLRESLERRKFKNSLSP